jgi:hypothetical protein
MCPPGHRRLHVLGQVGLGAVEAPGAGRGVRAAGAEQRDGHFAGGRDGAFAQRGHPGQHFLEDGLAESDPAEVGTRMTDMSVSGD